MLRASNGTRVFDRGVHERMISTIWPDPTPGSHPYVPGERLGSNGNTLVAQEWANDRKMGCRGDDAALRGMDLSAAVRKRPSGGKPRPGFYTSP
jgi:hypothetical protein